jgi:hypothetical protein
MTLTRAQAEQILNYADQWTAAAANHARAKATLHVRELPGVYEEAEREARHRLDRLVTALVGA